MYCLPSATPILHQLRRLSLDFQTFIKSADVLGEATQLHTLYLGGQDIGADEAEMEAAVDALRALQVCSAGYCIGCTWHTCLRGCGNMTNVFWGCKGCMQGAVWATLPNPH